MCSLESRINIIIESTDTVKLSVEGKLRLYCYFLTFYILVLDEHAILVAEDRAVIDTTLSL
jgi:hypothetical protein